MACSLLQRRISHYQGGDAMSAHSRRDFLTLASAGAALAAAGCRPDTTARPAPEDGVPTPGPQTSGASLRMPLGRTGIEVSALCLGGYHLGLVKTEQEAIRVVHEA